MPARPDGALSPPHGGRLNRAPGSILDLPEFNVAIFAFLLNYPWEFLQVPFYAGMADAAHWEAVKSCSRAAVGDAGIVLVVFWVVAAAVRSRQWILGPVRSPLVGFVAAGLIVTLALEWLATEVWDRWQYADAMPVLPVLGTGLLPILQWIVVPPLIVWFVRRQLT